jgi:3-oxoacyl-[acyl-carrier-protein] synthase-3
MSEPGGRATQKHSTRGHGVVVTGWGSALPDKVVTNLDFEQRLDTSDSWIVERTGIRERRMGGSSGSLAIEAGQQAIQSAGIDPASIDLVVLATTTPDQTMPATASSVQAALGTGGGAVDVNAACAGFVYALGTGAGMAAIGVRRILVIGADVMSRITDQDDRGTAVLFGDGAGALVLEAVEGRGALLGLDLGSDGRLGHLLYTDIGRYTVMDGPEVFRKAVRIMVESSTRALSAAGLTPDDVDLLVPHQANTRIIDAAARRLGIPMEKAALVLDRTGNTSAASIPLALVDALGNGRVADGDILLLCGFGAGMTWASAVVRWGRS